MKKLLFTVLAFLAMQNSQSQVLLNENCESLTIGNVGTDLTGVTPGQGGWLINSTSGPTDATDVLSVSDFQVINTGLISYGKALQIKGSRANGKTRRIEKDISSQWNSRISGSNTLEVSFRLFLPATLSNSDNTFSFAVSSTTSTTYCSFTIYKGGSFGQYRIYGNYFNGVGVIQPLLPSINYSASSNGYENFVLRYNFDTGNFRLVGGSVNVPVFDVNGTGVVPALADPSNIRFFVSKSNAINTINSASRSYSIDDIIVSAVNPSLDTDEFNLESNNFFTISPNPATSIISITNNENINVSKVTLADINGRVVKQDNYNNVTAMVNIENLASGLYFMTIISDKGIATRKIIKN